MKALLLTETSANQSLGGADAQITIKFYYQVDLKADNHIPSLSIDYARFGTVIEHLSQNSLPNRLYNPKSMTSQPQTVAISIILFTPFFPSSLISSVIYHRVKRGQEPMQCAVIHQN